MNRLLSMLQGRTVAIVGNAPVHSDFSKEIDAADVVIRFNDFYRYGLGRTGKRVDIILQTFTQVWCGRKDKHISLIRASRPAIFIVKRPGNYTTYIHDFLGGDVRIDNLSHFFEPWNKYTTGTASLCYLAQHLTNARVRVYGFGTDEDFAEYIRTDACGYKGIADEERAACLAAINKLHALDITSAPSPAQTVIVVPVKANSQGLPGKNRMLLRPCLDKLHTLNLPIHIVTDDETIIARHPSEFVHRVSPIQPLADVTNTLRTWRDNIGFCGDIAITTCTSPCMRPSWVSECLSQLKFAPVVATACPLGFKPTAIYHQVGNVFVRTADKLPASSVARQLLPPAFRINGAVVACHSDALDFNSLYDAGFLRPVYVSEEDSIDIDTQSDLDQYHARHHV